MKRRTMIGVAGAAAVSLVAGGAAYAVGAPSWRPPIMRRIVSAMIDEALAGAKVTPDQRTRIYAARDRVFAAVDQARQERQAHHDEVLRLFEADQVDQAQVDALKREGEAERQRIGDAIGQAFVEVHDVLTPAQRKAVADYVRAEHGRHWARHWGGHRG